MDWNSISSDVDTEVIFGGEERAESECVAFKLQVNLDPGKLHKNETKQKKLLGM